MVQLARASKVYLQTRGEAWQNGCARVMKVVAMKVVMKVVMKVKVGSYSIILSYVKE
jgi:hypothetical protein